MVTQRDFDSVHMRDTINGVMRTKRALEQKLGREPFTQEVAEPVGMSIERVNEMYRIQQSPVSIDMLVGEEEDSCFGDFIKDETVSLPDESAINSSMKAELYDILNKLSEREKQVIELRFGLKDGKDRTLEEVGDIFDVTRERIRQIKAKALRKIRYFSKNRLREYVI